MGAAGKPKKGDTLLPWTTGRGPGADQVDSLVEGIASTQEAKGLGNWARKAVRSDVAKKVRNNGIDGGYLDLVGGAIEGGADHADAWRDAQNAPDELPPTAPDLTDEALKKARRSAALRLTQGRGRKGTFLTDPMGDPTEPTMGRKTLLGG
jgi:hypothetical protein